MRHTYPPLSTSLRGSLYFRSTSMQHLLKISRQQTITRLTIHIKRDVYVCRFLSTLYIELQPCVDNILKCEELWTRATFVFDKHLDHIPISEQLQILDLPDMKENNLMSLTFRTTLDQIRQEKFSAPPAPTSTAGAINSASNKLVRPISSTNITRGSTSEDEILPEVNTGEYSSKKCCCCWC